MKWPWRRRQRLTKEAALLLDKVDAGGVPAFWTPSLARIAKEHGVQIVGGHEPNYLIDRLREMERRS